MSRSGYCDDSEQRELAMYRGAVRSAIHGKRGQSFLREMLAALDSLASKRLIAGNLEDGGEFCAIGVPGKIRGIDMSQLNPENPDHIARAFGLSRALVAEIEFINDEAGPWNETETPEERFVRVHKWVVEQILEPATTV